MEQQLTAEQNEILDLRDKVFELEERVRLLTSVLTEQKNTSFPTQWQLAPREARAVSILLAASGAVSRDTIRAAISPRANPEGNIVNVVMCNLRQKLKPFGVRIKTVREGYELPDSAREIIAESGGGLLRSVGAAA